MRNFINLSDIDKKELRKIINHAKFEKMKKSAEKNNYPLAGKTLIMIFEKPSLRTRLSFELAMKKLGGDVLVLDPKESHYGTQNESIHDTAKILSKFGDIVMLRSKNHKNFLEFSKYLEIPIINGLTNMSHPCQIMSDIMTFEELNGPITNKKIVWLGDGNNIVYSLIEAAVQFSFNLVIACPKKLKPDAKIIEWAKKKKANILITGDPQKAARGADAVITDKWISMGDKTNKKKKKKLLRPFQVNKKIMNLAKRKACFLHCLPANRGEEVTDEIIDGKQSAVWLEALNRTNIQKSILRWCLKLL